MMHNKKRNHNSFLLWALKPKEEKAIITLFFIVVLFVKLVRFNIQLITSGELSIYLYDIFMVIVSIGVIHYMYNSFKKEKKKVNSHDE